MRTSNRSFQLEETVPGIFLLQGWLGGVLAAFVYVGAICYWDTYINFTEALYFIPYFIVLASVLGVIKSMLMWGPYVLTKVQPRAGTRVIVASLATGLLALATGTKFGTGRTSDLIAWVVVLLLGGLPTAILIGSSVKPWELFTFGSIAGVRVRSVLGTLATLPLRFLSLGALAVWILSFACQRGIDKSHSYVAAGLAVPLMYLLISVYVTFRSPRKTILLALGLLMNLPIASIVVLAYVNHVSGYFLPAMLPVFSVMAIFVVAWIVFLAARLTVRTHPVFITDLSEDLLKAHEARKHDCLGSRFVEWQQRVA